MKYEIFGDMFPAVELTLEKGESIYTQSGGMTWMTDRITMDTNMRGGLKKGIGRMFSGESLFMATYTADAQDSRITIASTFPGRIICLPLTPGKEYICQKSSFLCAEPGVELSAYVTKGIGAGLFGGEGFVLQKVSGNGLVFLEMDGSVRQVKLGPGEKLKVDTGNVALFESTVNYSVETVKGFKNVLFGGEGLFLTTLTGPGHAWLQTISVEGVAKRIAPYIQTKSS